MAQSWYPYHRSAEIGEHVRFRRLGNVVDCGLVFLYLGDGLFSDRTFFEAHENCILISLSVRGFVESTNERKTNDEGRASVTE